MRFIRFDSVGGASGDMILAALTSLGADIASMAGDLTTVLPDRFELHREPVGMNGLFGDKLTVYLPDEADSPSHPHDDSHNDPNRDSRRDTHDELPDDSSDEPRIDSHYTDPMGTGHSHHERTHRHHHEEEYFCSKHHSHGEENHRLVHVPVHAHHHHRSFADIRRMIQGSALSETVKKHAVGIFQLLAEAEGAVHHRKPDEVHFHEVGAADSIIDITGSAIGFDALGVEGIQVGPLPVGSGTIRCAHGLIPIPAPATVELLRMGNLVTSPDGEPCEMLTPTAAAIFAYWPKITEKRYRVLRSVNAFGHREMPGRPNLLRASLCETTEEESAERVSGFSTNPADETVERVETLFRLDCNLDDISGEQIAAAAKACFEAGGLDVWITPILMKKGRPAQVLSVLVTPENRENVLKTIFRTTGTFGVREESIRRYALGRRFETIPTVYGPVSMKLGLFQGENLTAAPEFDDILRQAGKNGVVPQEVYDEAKAVFRQQFLFKER